jgi:3-oxoacyl-[acyl-carrier protein] reductase
VIDLSQQVALVTGAGSPGGIGFAAAQLLAAQGARLLLVSTTARIHERAAELGGDRRAAGHVADLTDPRLADATVRSALERFGRLDIVVNNAGMTAVGSPEPIGPVVEMPDAAWQLGLQRNLTTCFNVTRAALRPLLAAGYGRIVNVASTTGPFSAMPDAAAYAAAKAGMVGFTRAVALEVATRGITVNAVAPGWIATASSLPHELAAGKASPLGRPGAPAEVAAAIVFLASPEASYITGQCLVIDGANNILEDRRA